LYQQKQCLMPLFKTLKYPFKSLHSILSCFFVFVYIFSTGQIKKTFTSNTPKPLVREFVISYAINITGKKTDRFAQTYNGGLKTAFVKGDLVRLRLVSLMRVQSIYYNNLIGIKTKVATIVKESGKDRTIMNLSAKQWKQFNKKNDSLRIDFFSTDTLTILNKLCKKAIITSTDSSKVEVYYFPNAKNKTLSSAEPLFAKIPGLVLKYSIESNEKKIEYTAVNLKFGKIDPNVFNQPKTKDYIRVKYNPNGSITPALADEEEDDETTTEEEENEMELKADSLKITPAKPPLQ
jgi:hypothetical protein